MAIADRVPPPVWVEVAPKASGLDHLGLRLPVQTLGGQLLT
jgi:hypothetical protein